MTKSKVVKCYRNSHNYYCECLNAHSTRNNILQIWVICWNCLSLITEKKTIALIQKTISSKQFLKTKYVRDQQNNCLLHILPNMVTKTECWYNKNWLKETEATYFLRLTTLNWLSKWITQTTTLLWKEHVSSNSIFQQFSGIGNIYPSGKANYNNKFLNLKIKWCCTWITCIT